ncbi:hypothetical protein EUZ85_05440 [Hahella sp. KA22]|uniref:hypothetical protein n=1 Tax=Hahella sp. KA22 TaxID=1628392 RepID=UPI000FDE7FB4|nr:hypothetical protein [Hahella sp. KA22]AZZ90185.1 hypothetical protein ENC22_02890 [Hahella sp. KA22]QAY53555.1 hypothetical protein EUZ85_05440 [Hahella sp. KA22]
MLRILGILLLLSLTSCGFVEGVDDAKAAAATFFDDRIKEGGPGADRFYSSHFIDSVDPEEWESIRRLVQKANGDLRSYSLDTWRAQDKVQTNGLSGMYVTLTYKTTYTNGEGEETLILFRNDDSPQYKVMYHHFNSESINRLVKQGIDEAASKPEAIKPIAVKGADK